MVLENYTIRQILTYLVYKIISNKKTYLPEKRIRVTRKKLVNCALRVYCSEIISVWRVLSPELLTVLSVARPDILTLRSDQSAILPILRIKWLKILDILRISQPENWLAGRLKIASSRTLEALRVYWPKILPIWGVTEKLVIHSISQKRIGFQLVSLRILAVSLVVLPVDEPEGLLVHRQLAQPPHEVDVSSGFDRQSLCGRGWRRSIFVSEPERNKYY